MLPKHYLVTGGAGFIGSHLVDHLLAMGHQVTVVDDFSSGQHSNLSTHPQLTVMECSVGALDVGQLAGKQWAGIAHLAAIPSVGFSWQQPLTTHEANLSHTLHMAVLAEQLDCRRFVYASSAAVYGDPSSLPLDENLTPSPVSPYGLQKRTGEDYLALLAPRWQLEAVALRFFNVFGPRQNPRSEYSGVVSRFAAAALAGEPLCIRGDGMQTRDFVEVRDVARTVAAALQQPLPTARLSICNVGTGRQTSVKALAEALRRCSGARSEIRHEPAAAGDILHSQADTRRLRALFGIELKLGLDESLEALLDSLRR